MKLKSDSKMALAIVRDVIDEWDPYALLAAGAPADEFEAEIASVVAQIPRIKSQRDAAYAVSRVFFSAFHPGGFSPDDRAAVGTKLFFALREYGLFA